jgi:hypothetical protein
MLLVRLDLQVFHRDQLELSYYDARQQQALRVLVE